MGVITILAAIFALAATVLAFIFIVPEKKRANMNKVFGLLHDIFNFKFLIVEKIMQALYILSTAYVFLTGFFMLFYFEERYSYSYYSYYSSTEYTWMGGYGLLVMILGPIFVRLAYEFIMLAILLVKNVIQINNKMKAEDGKVDDGFSIPTIEREEAPAVAPQAPQAPQAPAFCPVCGTPTDGGSFCPSCGTRLD